MQILMDYNIGMLLDHAAYLVKLNLKEMERIRIIKRKRNKGSGYIWGILIAIILLGVVAWFLLDQDIIDSEHVSLKRNTNQTERYGEYRDSDENENFKEYRDTNELQENSGSNVVKSYVSFVNREVVPSDSIENHTKQKAVSLFQKAVNEIEEVSDIGHQNNADTSDRSATLSDSDEVAGLNPAERPGSDSTEQRINQKNNQNPVNSLIEAGNKLVNIQEREYPSLSNMGETLNSALNELESTDKEQTEDLKKFFIASSSLLQEIDSERNKLSYNKGMSYGDIE